MIHNITIRDSNMWLFHELATDKHNRKSFHKKNMKHVHIFLQFIEIVFQMKGRKEGRKEGRGKKKRETSCSKSKELNCVDDWLCRDRCWAELSRCGRGAGRPAPGEWAEIPGAPPAFAGAIAGGRDWQSGPSIDCYEPWHASYIYIYIYTHTNIFMLQKPNKENKKEKKRKEFDRNNGNEKMRGTLDPRWLIRAWIIELNMRIK